MRLLLLLLSLILPSFAHCYMRNVPGKDWEDADRIATNINFRDLDLKVAQALAKANVRQIVVGTTSTSTDTTGTTFIDTGLSVSITPLNSKSTIFIFVLQSVGAIFTAAANTAIVDLQLLRGASIIYGPKSVCRFTNLANTTELQFTGSLAYVDSPATSSSITYKTQFARNSSANAIAHKVQGDSTVSHIIAVELVP